MLGILEKKKVWWEWLNLFACDPVIVSGHLGKIYYATYIDTGHGDEVCAYM